MQKRVDRLHQEALNRRLLDDKSKQYAIRHGPKTANGDSQLLSEQVVG